MASSILSSVTACLNAFDELIKDIQNAAEGDPQDWEGERGRLRIWTAYTRADKAGPSSLDFRLRYNSRLRQAIIKFLDDLLERLQEVQRVRAEGEDASTQSIEEYDEAPEPYIKILRYSVAALIGHLNEMSILAENPTQIDLRIGVRQSDASG